LIGIAQSLGFPVVTRITSHVIHPPRSLRHPSSFEDCLASITQSLGFRSHPCGQAVSFCPSRGLFDWCSPITRLLAAVRAASVVSSRTPSIRRSFLVNKELCDCETSSTSSFILDRGPSRILRFLRMFWHQSLPLAHHQCSSFLFLWEILVSFPLDLSRVHF
jgi:hypothetical protein